MNNDLSSKGIPGVAVFEKGPGGLDVLMITAPAADATIFLHGAQLTHWQPRGTKPVIFLSGKSAYEIGKPIRGGVPVCLPWFGPRDGAPAHGFVRNRVWKVDRVEQGNDGMVSASFITKTDEKTLAIWPYEFVARLTYRIGSTLEMELQIENTSYVEATFTEALHTYFVVGDARQASVEGLDGTMYRDFPDRTKLTTQSGPVVFTEETDRVYVNTKAACVLVDPVLGRRITVDKEGSDSTVVWNPWVAKSAAMADFGDDEWPGMVCIETANAFENSVTLGPSMNHRMTVRISVENIS